VRKGQFARLLSLFILVSLLVFAFGGMLAVFAAESEPNNTAGTADVLPAPTAADWGYISPVGDIDWWEMGGASVGDLVFVYIDATGSTISVDSVLNVYANDGTTLIEWDDDGGPSSHLWWPGQLYPKLAAFSSG